jgi:hypothetical protein
LRQVCERKAEKARLWNQIQLADIGVTANYDVSADGKRVVALTGLGTESDRNIPFLFNFLDEVRRRVAAANTKYWILRRAFLFWGQRLPIDWLIENTSIYGGWTWPGSVFQFFDRYIDVATSRYASLLFYMLFHSFSSCGSPSIEEGVFSIPKC